MPLRDHFRPPLADRRSWEGFHGGWPTMIVIGLNRKLPDATSPSRRSTWARRSRSTWRPTRRTRTISPSPARRTTAVGSRRRSGPAEADAGRRDRPAGLDEYEVRVYDTKAGRRLVAAVEIVSPANKDRPEHRRAFVAKCAALLQNHVCVAIVDLVTTRTANLYGDLMELLGQTDPSLADGASSPLRGRLSLWPGKRTPGCWRPGRIPWRSAGRCRRCRCGSPKPRGATRAGAELRGDVPHPPPALNRAFVSGDASPSPRFLSIMSSPDHLRPASDEPMPAEDISPFLPSARAGGTVRVARGPYPGSGGRPAGPSRPDTSMATRRPPRSGRPWPEAKPAGRCETSISALSSNSITALTFAHWPLPPNC